MDVERLVAVAGAIYNGIWDTPSGNYVTITDPVTRSTTITPLRGFSATSIEEALSRVRSRFLPLASTTPSGC